MNINLEIYVQSHYSSVKVYKANQVQRSSTLHMLSEQDTGRHALSRQGKKISPGGGPRTWAEGFLGGSGMTAEQQPRRGRREEAQVGDSAARQEMQGIRS